jgi:hypothetical protein
VYQLEVEAEIRQVLEEENQVEPAQQRAHSLKYYLAQTNINCERRPSINAALSLD